MEETHQHTTLIYKGQPGNWCMQYQVDQPTPEDIYQGWEIVGIRCPKLIDPSFKTLDKYLEACGKYMNVPQPLLDYMKEACDLIPITVTYTY